jgi:hypothetical protein
MHELPFASVTEGLLRGLFESDLGANSLPRHNAAMKYRAIIQESWALTQSNKKLLWGFSFIPSLISTLVFVVYGSYQAYALWDSALLFGNGERVNDLWRQGGSLIFESFQNHPGLSIFGVMLAAILGVIYILLPPFMQGALIQLMVRARNGHPISIREGIGLGFRRFLQLFEYDLAIRTFSVVTVATNALFILRNFGPSSLGLFVGLFSFIGVVALFLTLLFTYSEYAIVIDDDGLFEGMMKSAKLVMRYWDRTLFMLFLMALISVRILINILAALLIPLLVIGPILFFTSITLAQVGWVLGILLGSISLYFTSYFVGVFHVFTTGVWTFTFLELSAEPENNLREEVDSVQEEENQNEG